jgi:hypothetical protein
MIIVSSYDIYMTYVFFSNVLIYYYAVLFS